MVVDLPRRWRWAIGLGFGLAVVLGGLFVAASWPVDAARSMVAAAMTPSGVVEAPMLADAVVAVSPGPDGSGAHGVDEVQVCGGGWVRKQPDGSIDPAEFERATRMSQTGERIVAKLRASASELARASALLVAMLGADDEHRRAIVLGALDCRAAECQSAPAAVADIAQARDALARMAASTTDPKVYALAFKVCGAKQWGEGSCQMLSAEQWARLDPANAAPWQFILSNASARGDRAAQDEALFRIATAQRSEIGYFDVAGAVLGAMPDDDTSRLAALAMVMSSVGMEAGVAIPGLQTMAQACKASALRDANRAQTCAAIAEVLAERSDTLLEREIGVAIGKQIGWPTERIDRMRGEYAAYAAQMPPRAADGNDFGCTHIRRELDIVQRDAALGEVGAMREWVARSGKKPEDFVLLERTRQRQAQQAVREAAASAAAASAGH